MDPASFVFLDETGATTNMVRRYGWGPKHERLVDADTLKAMLPQLASLMAGAAHGQANQGGGGLGGLLGRLGV